MQAHVWTICGRRSLLAATLGLLAISGMQAQQQQQQQRTMTITYRKAAPGKGADHRKFVETSWKKYMQAAVDEGGVQGAMALRLTAPYAAGSPHDWAVVVMPTKRPSLAGLDPAVAEAQAKKAGFANRQAYLDQGNALSSVVRAEWVNTAMRIGSIQAGNYIRASRYMAPQEHRAEQLEFLRDVALPLNSQAMKDGRIVGWSVNTPVGALGGPNEAGFSTSIVVVLKDADSVWAGPAPVDEARIKQVFPSGMTLANYINRLNRVNDNRKPISTRMWEVVAMVGKAPEITPARAQ